MINWVLLSVVLLQNASLLVYGEAVGVHKRVQECDSDEFKCGSGPCIYKGLMCDQKRDCSDGSDEEKCDQCGNTVSGLCLNDGKCVPTGESFTCLCRPSTTGALCETVRECESDEFKCGSGPCLYKGFICNKERDCSDGSDEEKCDQCGNTVSGLCLNDGKCVPTGESFTCLCHRHTTGALCETVRECESDEFKCGGGPCIYKGLMCDKEWDCSDGSDEEKCDLCGDTHSGRCQNAGKCVPNGNTIRCLCNSGYTGELCETALPCMYHQFTCRNGMCINKRFKCDGVKDCGDESDEDTCGPSKQRLRKYELKKRLFGLF